VVNYVDLLRVTSAMLRTQPDVRRALQAKYRFLFIDEFQDTDPIQADIFLMLAADEELAATWDPASAGFDPFAVPLRPGALFVVGDPKQSIFRFRRADIDIYNRVARRIKETGGEVLSLTANFRSLPSVCEVANTIFPPLFAERAYPYSPAFEKLDPVRDESEAPAGPRVARITIPDSDDVEPVEEEARRVATYIKAEVSSGRRKFGDFLVLNRMRPRLRTFAEAFDALEVPVDVSGGGMFCDSSEVRALSALLSALSDPLDSVALVGVLRGPLFGLSDPELFRLSQAGGRFDLWAPLPEKETSDIAAVMAALRDLQAMWRDTRLLPLGAAVDQILERTGWLALAATTPGCAPAGHLLQAVDLVRQVVEEGGGLREAAEALNEEEPSGESEALPLEPGRRDVVRIMNLHKAKGLEADVVFLADATHEYEFPLVVRIEREGGRARGHLKIASGADEPWKRKTLAQPAGWDAHEEEESRYRDAERLRLLYVAGTRARDLLVICRSAKAGANKAWAEFEGYVAGVPELLLSEDGKARATGGVPVPHACGPDDQRAARRDRVARYDRVRQPSWAATSVTSGDRTHPEDRAPQAPRFSIATPDSAPQTPDPSAPSVPSLPPFDDAQGDRERNRSLKAGSLPFDRPEAPGGLPDERRSGQASDPLDVGAEWGSLVHGLLEHKMRHAGANRADLERLARWLTVESPELRNVIPEALDLAETVSTAPFWKDARLAGEVHVEVPCAVRVDAGMALARGEAAALPTVLRGAIDLVYRAADGWRIIDYKTDRDAEDAAALLERHGAQLGQYKMVWERATGTKVSSTAVFAVRNMRLAGSDRERK
jgi:ATP-dependent helicase/nuclease subunit A